MPIASGALLLTGAPVGNLVHAQAISPDASAQWIPGPGCHYVSDWNTPRARLCTDKELVDWTESISSWRSEQRLRSGFDDVEYDLPSLKWMQNNFIELQMMVHDRYFFDNKNLKYSVNSFIDDVDRRYGGIDSVLLWHGYPNLGIDDRNQFDLFRDLPGGIPAMREAVSQFHRRGVRVFVPFTVWDRGTRDEGLTGEKAIAIEAKAIDADGVNGDTLVGAPRSFFDASIRLGHMLAIEPQLGLASDEMLGYNIASWAEEYSWPTPFVPAISRYKWLETKHMVHFVRRFAHDRTNDLQVAFLNGAGYQPWENIWGQWNGMTSKDGQDLARIHAIYNADGEYLTSEKWEPYVATLQFGTFASRWPLHDNSLWTVVNRNPYAVDGVELAVRSDPGTRFYDLWNGTELVVERKNGMAVLSFPLAAHGFGAILATRDPLSVAELALQHEPGPAVSVSALWQPLPQRMQESLPSSKANSGDALGMVRIPAADFQFKVHGIEVEGMNDEGADVQYPWESSPRRYHNHQIHIASYLIDRYPVTNAEFHRFLVGTHYVPADSHNFLRDWKNGKYPIGWDNKPVTWVSRDDAQAYAKWEGKRLPHEWEWQYAAQGLDGRAYPWGAEADSSRVPAIDDGRVMSAASEVSAHPSGASPFGVMDLVGNIWQWTDEFSDDHTRAAILRGGSHYHPKGSDWYFPEAYRLDEHGKYLLMAASLDRSGAIGFRCVQDIQP